MIDRFALAKLVAFLEAGLDWSAACDEVFAGEPLPAGLARVDALIASAGVQPASLLRSLLEQVDAQSDVERRIEIAMAAPKATLRLVTWLPVGALLLGQLSGLGTIVVLFRQPIALVAVCLGGVLLVLGKLWSGRMLTRALAEPVDDSFGLVLIASCLRSGFDLASAERLSDSTLDDDNGKSIVELATRTGVPVADLLLSFSQLRRTEALQTRLAMIERLSVRLMVPLGVTVLPAFVLMAVVPLAISFLSR